MSPLPFERAAAPSGQIVCLCVHDERRRKSLVVSLNDVNAISAEVVWHTFRCLRAHKLLAVSLFVCLSCDLRKSRPKVQAHLRQVCPMFEFCYCSRRPKNLRPDWLSCSLRKPQKCQSKRSVEKIICLNDEQFVSAGQFEGFSRTSRQKSRRGDSLSHRAESCVRNSSDCD